MRVVVHSAAIQYRDGAELVLNRFLKRDGQQLGQQAHIAFRRFDGSNQRLQFVEPCRRGVLTLEIGRAFQLRNERE